MGVRIIGLFRKRKQEIRADTAESAILTFFDSNKQLTRAEAMEIPTISACVSKIGDAVSRLPIKLYRKADGVVREITEDSRIDLLNRDTGDTLSTVDMWKAVTADYFLGRGAWIFVNSNGINVKSLHYVDCGNISIMSNNDPIFKAFTVHVNDRKFYDFQFMKLLRRTKDGFTNIPLQADNSKILSAAYNSLLLEKMMSANGGCKPGFIKAKTRLSKEAINQIKESYPEVYDNGDSSKKIVVLNDGVEFEAISSTAAELQMNENKKVNSMEICKLFGFPHTIIDGGASESDKREFVAVVIDLLNQIETELDRCLLLESEKQDGYYWAFDTKELTRGSILERYQAYEIAVRNRFLQIDEIRQAEDYDPIGFNFVTLGLGDVLLNPETLEVFTPNTGQSKNLLTGEERALPLELRYNHNHDEKGRFAPSRGGGGVAKSAKRVDKSGESGIIEETSKKAITPITDTSIEKVPKVEIIGYTEEQCDLIQKQHKELLEYSRLNNDNKEVAFVFDSDLTNRREFIGADDNLDFGNILYGTDLFVMHNHPRNSTYSDRDMKFIIGNDNIKTLTIVKNNGSVEVLAKSEKYDKNKAKTELKRCYKKYVSQGTDSEIDNAINAFLKNNKGVFKWTKI